MWLSSFKLSNLISAFLHFLAWRITTLPSECLCLNGIYFAFLLLPALKVWHPLSKSSLSDSTKCTASWFNRMPFYEHTLLFKRFNLKFYLCALCMLTPLKIIKTNTQSFSGLSFTACSVLVNLIDTLISSDFINSSFYSF